MMIEKSTMIRKLKRRLQYDLNRVDYQIAAFKGSVEEEGYRDDFLRHAVIILHSTLESTLRELLRMTLKECDGQTLKAFWQKCNSPKIQPDELTNYRDVNGQEFINDLVDKWLEKNRYSAVGDIRDALEIIGFPKDTFDVDFDLVASLMNKRHLIAHRGDRLDPDEEDYGRLRPIRVEKVILWKNVTEELLECLLGKIWKIIPRRTDAYLQAILSDAGIDAQ
jgi:hypothetical protein